MKSTGNSYGHIGSYQRMKEILDSSDANYEESTSLPDREKLTFKNGYYTYCSAMFVDIQKSSSLPEKYKRPRLAKLYRAYLSEVVAVMDGNPECTEISIVGDGVWGVFNTPLQVDINATFSTAAKVASAIEMLNYQLRKHNYESISVGTGLSYGRALVIKAGYSSSGINDIVYMGDVVNQVAKLAAHGNETWFDKQLLVSEHFYSNLNGANKKLLNWSSRRNAWHGNIIDPLMNEWYSQNCT